MRGTRAGAGSILAGGCSPILSRHQMLLGLGATQQWERLNLQGSATWGSLGLQEPHGNDRSLARRPGVQDTHSLYWSGVQIPIPSKWWKLKLNQCGDTPCAAFMWYQGVWMGMAGTFLHRVISSHQHLVFGPGRSMPHAGKSLCTPWATGNRTRPHSRHVGGSALQSGSWTSLGKNSLGTLCSRTP